MYGRRLHEARKSKDFTLKKLAEKVGVTDATLSYIENEKRKLSAELAQKISFFLNTTPEYLLYGKETPERPAGAMPVTEIAILGESEAGEWQEMILDPNTPKIPVPTIYARGNNFALKVKGESMHPTIPENSCVIVDPDDQVIAHNKVYCIADNEGNSTIKRVKLDGKDIWLTPDNKQYSPKPAPDGAIVIGRIIAFYGEL